MLLTNPTDPMSNSQAPQRSLQQAPSSVFYMLVLVKDHELHSPVCSKSLVVVYFRGSETEMDR